MVGANRIRMDASDSLWEKIRLPAKTVSIFGLLNNPQKDIEVYFDREILTEKISLSKYKYQDNFCGNPGCSCFCRKFGF